MTGTGDGDDVSPETLLMAAQVRQRAASAPSPGQVADMAQRALQHDGKDMSAAEIRELAESALSQARQVSFLLSKLAGLLDDPGGEPHAR